MRGAPTRGPAVVTLAMTLAMGAVACGVPTEDGFQPVASRDIPFGLQDTTTTTTTTTTIPPSTTSTTQPVSTTSSTTIPAELVNLYFVLGSTIQPVTRELPRPVTNVQVLEQLQEGPSRSEQRDGIRSSLPAELIGALTVAGGTATIDLSPELFELTGTEQQLVFAQLVLTLTDLRGIGRVAFTVEGQPIDVQLADGTLATGSVSRDDFVSLLPIDPTATTTSAPVSQ